MTYQDILAHCEDNCLEVSKIVGMDDCIVGLGNRNGEDVLLYSEDRIIRSLMETNDWDYHDAVEYCTYNVTGGFFNSAPVFVDMMVNLNEK